MRGIILLTAVALSGCNRGPRTENVQQQQQQPVQIGRWTIIHSPHVQRSAMLVDTATGQTWSLVTVSEGTNERYAWEPVARSNEPLPFPDAPTRQRQRDTQRYEELGPATENNSWPGTPANSN